MLAHVVSASLALVPCERHFDFGTWPGTINAKFTVRIRAADGTAYVNTYELFPGCSVRIARDSLMDHLKDAGWTVRPIGDGAFALLGPKAARVRSVKLEAAKGWQPLVWAVPVVNSNLNLSVNGANK